MRWVGQGLLVLTLVGCSRDNPWFVVNSAGAVDSEASSAGTTSVGSTRADVSSSSGDSGQVDMTTSTSTSSSASADPPDSSSTTIDPGSSSSGEPDASTGSSTGDPEDLLPYNLYTHCPEAMWADGANGLFQCDPFPKDGPSITQNKEMFAGQWAELIVVYPQQMNGSILDGGYMVPLMGTTSPHLQATVFLPFEADPKDRISVVVYVEIPLEVDVASEPIQLAPGVEAIIDLPLGEKATMAAEVQVHLQVAVDNVVDNHAVGVWVNPQIVEGP